MKAVVLGIIGYMLEIGSFMFLLFTAGVSDQGFLDISTIIIRVVLSIVMGLIGYLLINLGRKFYRDEQKTRGI